MYAIIYSVVALVLYTVVLLVGFYRASKQNRYSVEVLMEVKNILEEIKGIIMEEENNMSKGKYKNSRSSEMVHREDVAKPMYWGGLTKGEEDKGLSLEHLITAEPTEENYETVINLLIKLLVETYKDYKFLLAKSSDETQQPHFLQVVSNWAENPEIHKSVFQQAVEYNLDMRELQRKFAERVAEGKVLDLGDVEVIIDDGTGQPATGVSQINSGLEGGEIAFIISFLKKENYEAWYANTFPQEESPNEPGA